MNQKINTLLGTIILVIIAITTITFVWISQKRLDETSNTSIQLKHKRIIENVACPANAKQCSDRSYVSRKGPDCEFALCPDEKKSNIAGGTCDYEKISGMCKIISLTQTDAHFSFTSIGSALTIQSVKSLDGEYTDALYIFNPQNIPIEVNATINCEANLITKGTCTPILFKLTNPTSKNIFWKSEPQGDFTSDDRDASSVCKKLQTTQKLGNCKLLTSKKSSNKTECSDGMSVAGCFACQFDCN